MMTKTTLVTKCVMAITGKGRVFFNDKLVDGTRSLKVWGWSDSEYYQAKEMLTKMGCKAKVKQFPSRSIGFGPFVKRFIQVRLYVQE